MAKTRGETKSIIKILISTFQTNNSNIDKKNNELFQLRIFSMVINKTFETNTSSINPKELRGEYETSTATQCMIQIHRNKKKKKQQILNATEKKQNHSNGEMRLNTKNLRKKTVPHVDDGARDKVELKLLKARPFKFLRLRNPNVEKYLYRHGSTLVSVLVRH